MKADNNVTLTMQHSFQESILTIEERGQEKSATYHPGSVSLLIFLLIPTSESEDITNKHGR